MSTDKECLPELPLEKWEKTKMTLHLFLQIIGKIRLSKMPRKNHWWFITEYVSPKGLTTHAIPYEDGFHNFEITLNFIQHQLEVTTSKGESKSFLLKEGLTVASFYKQLINILQQCGIEVNILDQPYDLPIKKPFVEISEYHFYDKEYIERFWRILLWVNSVFEEFGGRFYGKTCPTHLYWHHMDLAMTRFSGKKGPALPPDWRISDKDAYSHEVISFGFWAGDDKTREPAFYSYTYPSPKGLEKELLRPVSAKWTDNNGSPMALFLYNDLRKEPNPRNTLLDFLESSYEAGSKLAKWDVQAFKVPALKDIR